MREDRFRIDIIPAVLYGDLSDNLYLFVHGKCGCKEEGKAFAEIVCPKDWQVLAIDLPEHGERQGGELGFDPWHAVPELRCVLAYIRQRWGHIALRATSIGAWFSMQAFAGEPFEKALFVSPVLDMEQLIRNMMLWAGVDEKRLQAEQEIPTDFGETLSWRYLQCAKEHPVTVWNANTVILYAGKDNLTGRTTVDEFVRRFGCRMTVMEDGEHWFHTPEQLAVLQSWEKEQTEPEKAESIIKITHGTAADIDSWMKLVRRMRDLFPGLETELALSEHQKTVLEFMDTSGAVCAKDGEQVVGALLFSPSENVLCYLAVDDRYQRRHIAQDMIRYVLPLTNLEKDITVTTYREDDPNGTAARAFYQHFGFKPGALAEEFGSPVQVFVLRRQS